MSFRRALVAPLAGLSLLIFVGGAQAAPSAGIRLDRLVPARTLAFASLEDVGGWNARFKGTALSKLGEEPEMKAFMAPFEELGKKMLEGGGAPGMKGFKIPPVFLAAMQQLNGLRGQAAIALVDVVPGSGPVVAASLDFGDHLSDFVAFLEKLRAEIGKDGPPIATEQKDGKTWWSVSGPQGRAMVAATTVGTAFMVSTDPTWLAAAAAAPSASVQGSLADSESFQASVKNVGGDGAAIVVYANVPSILERVGLPPEVRQIANAVGLDTVRSAAYGMSVEGDGYLESFFVDAPNADHGVLPLTRMRPTSHRDLSLAPSSAFVYAEGTPAYSKLVPGIRELLGKIEPDAAQMMEKVLSDVKEAVGVDVETELLAALSDEYAEWVGLPETGGLYPEAAILFGVKDPKAFEPVMEKAVNGLASFLGRTEKISAVQRTMEYRGQRLHLLDLAAVRGRDVIPFTPTWTMLGDRLVLTLVPHTMKEIVLRSQAKDTGGGLAAQEDVKSLLRAAPEGHGAFLYLDLQSLLALAYDTVVPLLQTAAKPNVLKDFPVQLDWAALPAARTIRPYLRSLAVYETSDERGFRASIHGPLPLVIPVFVAASVAIPFMVAARMEHNGHPRSVPGHGRVMPVDVAVIETASAVQAYVLDHKKLPDSLSDLTKPGANGQPYLAVPPKDTWGHDLELRPGQGTDFQVVSAGVDGVWGTDDDLSWPPAGVKVPNPPRPGR
jgi:hypothetical protein